MNKEVKRTLYDLMIIKGGFKETRRKEYLYTHTHIRTHIDIYIYVYIFRLRLYFKRKNKRSIH